MTDKEAQEILEWLTGCFGKRLLDNERLVWLATLAEMDASKAMGVALQFGKSGERFPSVPEFRRTVRGGQPEWDSSWRKDPDGTTREVPTWVNVWAYCRWGREVREERALPQQFGWLKGAETCMSEKEYESYHKEWVKAGSPKNLKAMWEILGATP